MTDKDGWELISIDWVDWLDNLFDDAVKMAVVCAIAVPLALWQVYDIAVWIYTKLN